MNSSSAVNLSNKAFFIALEGIDGSGKTSHIPTVEEYLHEYNLKTLVTREPGGTRIAEQIRYSLLKNHPSFEEDLTSEAETLLFYAARIQHIKHVIQPSLNKGISVISDRFVDSSYAYQSGGRFVSVLYLDQLTHWLVNDCIPDLTFVFDLPVEQALARIINKPLDRIEKEQLDFHQRVRKAYLDRVQKEPKRYVVINADQNKAQVSADIQFYLQKFLRNFY